MINKNVKELTFNDKWKYYDEWWGSIDHQVWLMNCGYKFGYLECCIFDFINDAIVCKLVPKCKQYPGPRSSKSIRYLDSPSNQFWIPCWYHYNLLPS